MEKVNVDIKVCCNNMLQAVKIDIVSIDRAQFCMTNMQYKLKEPTKDHDTAIIKMDFCPWCGANLQKITDEINKKLEEKFKNNEEKTNALGKN